MYGEYELRGNPKIPTLFYFGDLWKRTDANQRTCLIAIKGLGEGDLLEILQKSNLDEKTTRRTLQSLLKRDLIVLENGTTAGVAITNMAVASRRRRSR